MTFCITWSVNSELLSLFFSPSPPPRQVCGLNAGVQPLSAKKHYRKREVAVCHTFCRVHFVGHTTKRLLLRTVGAPSCSSVCRVSNLAYVAVCSILDTRRNILRCRGLLLSGGRRGPPTAKPFAVCYTAFTVWLLLISGSESDTNETEQIVRVQCQTLSL